MTDDKKGDSKLKQLGQTVVGVVKHAVETGQILERKSLERLAICRKCSQYSPNQFCKQCGCYLPVKTKLAGAHCPLKLW